MSGSSQTGIDAHDTDGAISNAGSFATQYGDSFEALYIDQADTDAYNAQTENDADGPPGGSLANGQTDALPVVSIFEPNYLAVTPYEQGNSPDLANNDDQNDLEGGPGGNPPGLSYTLGYTTGVDAIASAGSIDQPQGSAIYIALDFDTGPSGYFTDNQQDVQAFLAGVTAAFAAAGNPYKIGVYGSGQVLEWAITPGSGTDSKDETYTYTPNVSYTWLSGSTGWAGYNLTGPDSSSTATHGWTMIQSSSSTTQDGVPVDVDTTDGGDIGAWTTPCYCRGTMIRTERGDVAVEALTIGDRVVTHAGALEPIRWIGRRSYAGRFLAGNRHLLPICFKPGSLGEGMPRRDLWVSPKHAMFLDGVLVPAELLVNGVSVVQAEHRDSVEYFHVELPRHEVIWAEGAASESFVDDNGRAIFHNARDYARLYPDAVSEPAVYCAPRVEDGYAVEKVWRLVAERAGIAGAPHKAALRGSLDEAGGTVVRGWAQDPANPEAPVCLDVLVDGVLIAQTLANHYRADLKAAELGSGWHSFRLSVPLPETGVVEVRRSADAVLLGRAELAPMAAAA